MTYTSSWISLLLVLIAIGEPHGGQPQPDDNGVIHGY